MQINIQARNFALSDEVTRFVERRLRFALGRLDEKILHVTVRLSDINGPRGGIDKHCHLHVALKQVPDVVIEDTEADVFVAVTRAADRAGRAVLRRLDKQRNPAGRPAEHTLLVNLG